MSDVQQQILDELKQLNRQSGTKNTQSSGGILPSFDFLRKAEEGATALLTSFGKLTTGSYTLNDALGDGGKFLENFGDIGRVVSTIAQKGGGLFIEMNNSLKEASDSGIYFKNSLGEYSKLVTGARMSFEQFNQIVKDSGERLSGLGPSADGGAKAILTLMKQVHEAGGPNGLAYQLQATGIGVEVFNDVLLKSAANRKFIDLSEQANRDAMANSTVKLVEEMDNLSRLYGISASQQRKDLQDQLDQSSMRARFNTLNVNQQNNIVETLTGLRAAGKGVQDIFTEMATSTTPGAVRSRQGTETAAALSLIDGRLVPILREIAVLSKSESPEAKARAAELQRTFNDIYAQGIRNERVANTVADLAYTKDPVIERLTALYQQAMPMAGTEAQLRLEAARTGKTVEELRAEALRRAPKGKEEEDAAALSRTLNQLDRFTKDLNAAGGLAFNKLNTEIGGVITKFEGLNNVLKNWSPEDMKKAIEKIFDGIKKSIEDVIKPANRADIPRNAPKPGENLEIKPKFAGGDVFRDRLYTVGELGPEFFAPNVDGNIITNDSIRSGFSSLNVIQADMRAALSSARQTTNGLSKFQETLERMILTEQPRVAPESQPASAPIDQLTAAMINIDRGLEKLNISMQTVRTAIEQSTDKNIRALKSAGNMI